MTRTVVVTGGGTGIGRAVAGEFAKAGDTVVLTGRRPEPLRASAAELGAHARVCDGTDPEQVARFAATLERVDVLVNSAGGNTDLSRDAPTDLTGLAASWRANLDANLLTAVLMTEALRDRLVAGGSVVHIGSIAAERGGGSYGAAKAALASWNAYSARALGTLGVTTNVVSPGYIADTEFFHGRLSEQRREQLIAETSTGRAGTPEDIAGTAFFLASAAARHITAQVIQVNGGAWATR